MKKKNHIIAGYIIEKNPEIINYLYDDYNIINYLFNSINSNNYELNFILRFIIKILKPIIKNKIVDNNLINFQDNKNELFGFKILNSKLSSEDKILIFNLIKDFIDPLKINNYENSSKNILNYPLIIHSLLLNEYEITFILLNILIKNGVIKKNLKSKNENMTIFDYYHNESSININIIPMIFKFIKDNHNNFKNFDETKLYKINDLLSIDNDAIITILLLIKITNFIIIVNLKNNKINNYEKNYANISKYNNITKSNTITETNNITETNKYLEISIENNNTILDTSEYKIENKIYKNNKNIEIIKNSKDIWLNNKKTINEKKTIKDKIISEESNISVSDILFD